MTWRAQVTFLALFDDGDAKGSEKGLSPLPIQHPCVFVFVFFIVGNKFHLCGTQHTKGAMGATQLHIFFFLFFLLFFCIWKVKPFTTTYILLVFN